MSPHQPGGPPTKEFVETELRGARFLGADLSGVDGGTEGDGFDTSTTSASAPSYDEVLTARAGRVAMVGDRYAVRDLDAIAAIGPGSPR